MFHALYLACGIVIKEFKAVIDVEKRIDLLNSTNNVNGSVKFCENSYYPVRFPFIIFSLTINRKKWLKFGYS